MCEIKNWSITRKRKRAIDSTISTRASARTSKKTLSLSFLALWITWLEAKIIGIKLLVLPTRKIIIKSMKIDARAIYYILRVIHYKKWNEHLFSNMSCDISKHRQMGPGNQFPVSKSGSSTLTDARMTSYNKSNFRFMWYINTYINWAMKFTFEFKNSFWVLWPMR